MCLCVWWQLTSHIKYHICAISVTFVNLLLPFFKDFSQTWESDGFSTSENPWHCFPLVPLEAFGHEILIARDMPKGIELLRQMGQGSILETGEVWNDNENQTIGNLLRSEWWATSPLRKSLPIPFSPPGNDEPMNPGHKLRILHETEVLCELVIFGC